MLLRGLSCLKGDLRMCHRSGWIRTLSVSLSFLILTVTAPVSFAETVAGRPLGTITTQGSVMVGQTAAPTGTTIFAGDKVTSKESALISFRSGGRVEMTRASAAFERQGDMLIVKARQGLIRFNFQKGELVQIAAGKYRFSPVNSSGHVGAVGLDEGGQIVMNMEEGVFSALNTDTGEMTQVAPDRPLVVANQSGQGQLTKGGKSLTDPSKILQINELKGMCVVGGSEAYRITGNSPSVVTIAGAWKMNNGIYDYKVVECTKQAMMSAGASPEAAAEAAKGVSTSGASSGMGAHKTLLIVAGVGAGAGLGVGVFGASKSSSKR
jgi:hypothetical protein